MRSKIKGVDIFNSQCTDSMLNFSVCQFEVYSMNVSKMVNDSPKVLNFFFLFFWGRRPIKPTSLMNCKRSLELELVFLLSTWTGHLYCWLFLFVDRIRSLLGCRALTTPWCDREGPTCRIYGQWLPCREMLEEIQQMMKKRAFTMRVCQDNVIAVATAQPYFWFL